MADKTFKSIVHALRLSGINIPKNALLPSQLLVPVSSSEEEDMDGIEEEDGHDSEEEHVYVREEDAYPCCGGCHILAGSRMQPLVAAKSWLVPG
jgi:hypothetical protein